MGKLIDKYRADLTKEPLSYTELENYMNGVGYYLVETDDSDTIRFTNYKREIWIDAEPSEDNNLIVMRLRSVTKKKDEKTKVDEFESYEDLEKVLNYFKEKDFWHHWLAGWLCTSLGRRVGDTLSLKWSDLFNKNGSYKHRMNTLKEEKTGKVLGVRINALAQSVVNEYIEHFEIDVLENYNKNIFNTGDAALRKVLKEAVMETKIRGDISTHSFRKFYANTLYKLHPDDVDNLKVIQTILGHSSEEITKIYIGEIDRKIDKYNEDYSNYMIGMRNGKKMEFDHRPTVRFKAEDFREILSKTWDMAKNGTDKFDGLNEMISFSEKRMV